MQWDTKIRQEKFGATHIELETLASLDATIDTLFEELQREGREAELDHLCPYFGVVWPSARALAVQLESEPLEPTRGAQRILEVGCGLAVPSLVLLRQLWLSKVTVTDPHPEVRRFLASNLARNGFGADAVEFQAWSFNDLSVLARKWDFVIGSDVLYESQHPGELAEALNHVTHPNGRILITDPARPYLQAFSDEMKARGWFAEAVLKPSWTEDGTPKDVFLLDFSREKPRPLNEQKK